jgi:hypothetical protein
MLSGEMAQNRVGRVELCLQQSLSGWTRNAPSPGTAPQVHFVQVLAVQQAALEGLDHFAHFPLGSIHVLEQFLDTVPLRGAVEFALGPLVEKFAVLGAHVLLIFSAILDFHRTPPFSNRLSPNQSVSLGIILKPNHKPRG